VMVMLILWTAGLKNLLKSILLEDRIDGHFGLRASL